MKTDEDGVNLKLWPVLISSWFLIFDFNTRTLTGTPEIRNLLPYLKMLPAQVNDYAVCIHSLTTVIRLITSIYEHKWPYYMAQ
jgi:hypothetical protein